VSEDEIYLRYIIECIDNIEELAARGRQAVEAAKHDRAALLYYLHTMAEATQRLSESIIDAHPEIDWIAITGFRNRLVHGYLNVNMNIVWNVIEHDLPALKQTALAIVRTSNN
jgi:uncharacterized protein with HEPN domain